MKKYAVTLKVPFNEDVKKTLEEAGVLCRYSTDLNPYLIFVKAEGEETLANLDFVLRVRESRSFKLYI